MSGSDVWGTSRVLLAGTLLSVACFAIGFMLTLLGRAAQDRDPRDLGLVLQAVLGLEPWGWSMLGVLVLLATPAAGLLVTAIETRRGEPMTALLALVVLAILALATGFALVR
ncbi:hypothetical protein BH24CHL6_BH24CHL6_17240 [soil metagenome]